MSEGKSAAGFLEWKAGQDPNVVMLYISAICCGIPLFCKSHHFRNVLKEEFGVDDSKHWLAVIFWFYGIYLGYKQLKELEDARGITGKIALPWWACLIVCVPLTPFMIGNMMERVNVLVASKQQ